MFQNVYYNIIECVTDLGMNEVRSVEKLFIPSIEKLIDENPDEKYIKAMTMLKQIMNETHKKIQLFIGKLSSEKKEIIKKINDFDNSLKIFNANCNINTTRVGFIINEHMKSKLFNDIEAFIACIQQNLGNEIEGVNDKYEVMYFIEDYIQYLMSDFIGAEAADLKFAIYNKFTDLAKELRSAYNKGFGKDVSEEVEKLLEFDSKKLLSTDMIYSGEFINQTKIIIDSALDWLRRSVGYHTYFILDPLLRVLFDQLKPILHDLSDAFATKNYINKTVKKQMVVILDKQALSIKHVYSQNLLPLLNTEMQKSFDMYVEQINKSIYKDKENLIMTLSEKEEKIKNFERYVIKAEELIASL